MDATEREVGSSIGMFDYGMGGFRRTLWLEKFVQYADHH